MMRGMGREVSEWVTQRDADVALDWGPNGLRAIAPGAGTVIVVDVLRFTTAVDVAVGRGATVVAYRWDRADDAAAAAIERGAVLGVGDDEVGPGLSPASLADLAPGERIILPSPNGAALVLGAADRGATTVIAACLRNAGAVARAVASPEAGRVAIVAAGERWHGATGPLRVAVEDLLGAGAVASGLRATGRSLSAEASVAADAFEAARHRLPSIVAACASGRNLVERGLGVDVEMATDLDVSAAVPTLVGDEVVAPPAGTGSM